MTDFYFIYSIIDIIWKIFSILFVLYRFTSFFSMIYGFSNFLGKLLKGFIYIKDQIVIYIKKRNNYSFENDHDLPNRPKSLFIIFKQNCKRIYNKIFGITNNNDNDNTYLPLYETRTSIIDNQDNFTNKTSIQTDDFKRLLHSDITTSTNTNNLFNSTSLYYTGYDSEDDTGYKSIFTSNENKKIYDSLLENEELNLFIDPNI